MGFQCSQLASFVYIFIYMRKKKLLWKSESKHCKVYLERKWIRLVAWDEVEWLETFYVAVAINIEHFFDMTLNLSSFAIDWANKKIFRITFKDSKRFLNKNLNDLCTHFS